MLSNVHEFLMYLATDAEGHGSEVTPQRGSAGVGLGLTSLAPGSLMGRTVCSDIFGTSRVLLEPRGSGFFAVPLPFPISILEELMLQI